MEIHHHPTAIGSHTARKRWTHYFWEFLMLFLAVFCGFLAENQWEHMIEHKREKQFVPSLISNLQLDIAWLDTVTSSARARIQNIDPALLMLAEQNKNEIPVSAYTVLKERKYR